MGKLLLYAFVAVLAITGFYLLSFVSYIALLLSSWGLGIQPDLYDMLSKVASLAPMFFLLYLPIVGAVSFIALLTLTDFRKAEKSPLTYDPITNPTICVGLTAYNDSEPIHDAVRDFLSQKGVTQVIVIDNNSKDDTTSKAEQAGATVIKETKQGYGYACQRFLKEALHNSNANIIVLAEGDRTFRGYDVSKLIPYLDNADLVLGTRTTQELLDQKSQLDWFYVWGNIFLAKLIQLKYFDVKCWGKVRLTDVGCTLRAIRPEALRKIVDQLEVGGDHFSPHMIMVALNNNLKVIEVPVTFRQRVGRSKGAGSNKKKAIKVGLVMLWDILTY